MARLTKVCSSCKIEKSWSDFYLRSDRKAPQCRCKECVSLKQKEYYQKNKEVIKPKKKQYAREHRKEHREYERKWRKRPESIKKINKNRKKHLLKKLYNLSVEDWDNMFREQSGRCLICGKHQSNLTETINTDHNHVTNQVRGLLCSQCNIGLGAFKVDYKGLELLTNAIKYLEENDESINSNISEFVR